MEWKAQNVTEKIKLARLKYVQRHRALIAQTISADFGVIEAKSSSEIGATSFFDLMRKTYPDVTKPRLTFITRASKAFDIISQHIIPDVETDRKAEEATQTLELVPLSADDVAVRSGVSLVSSLFPSDVFSLREFDAVVASWQQKTKLAYGISVMIFTGIGAQLYLTKTRLLWHREVTKDLPTGDKSKFPPNYPFVRNLASASFHTDNF